LVQQYLVESALLAVLGGTLALVFARSAVSVIVSKLPLPAMPEALSFHVDGRTLGFAATLSLVSALLFGLGPAWRAAQIDLTGALRSSQRGSATKRTRRLGRALLACQVGLSVLLSIGAGLFVQTLRNLVRLDVGFNPDSLLQLSLDTRGSGYREGQVGGLYRLLLERVSAIPGVQSVTGIRNSVMQRDITRTIMPIPGRTEPDEAWNSAAVGPSFFETMRMPVARGRTFTPADFERDCKCVVVSEAFVKRYFPNEDPVGKRIGDPPETGIIGVVKDARLTSVRTASGPMMYFTALGEPDRIGALEVRGIRTALGASRWSVIRESLRDTMQVFGIGLAAGIIAAIVAVRLTASFISDLLFGLTAADVANFVAAVLVIVAVALAACIMPARHATRIDVLTAIRNE
jgi:putative ABC transport system permease protein